MHIKSQSELERVCARMRQCGCMGLDSEFIPEHTYFPQLALVQVAVENDCFLMDPLRISDLSPLEDVLCSDDVITVVHAGTQDMGIFFHRMNRPPKRVFDTQVAASFLGMGHQVSYGAMVQQLFGVSLKKGQSYTDWMKRPLKPQQEKYALEDVAYLIGAYEKMTKLLDSRGRLPWVADELKNYETDDFYLQHQDHPEKRVKKSGHLNSTEQVILEMLARWREEKAQRKNLPRKKILSDACIVDLARRAPKNESELFSIRSVGYSVKTYVRELLDIIAQAKVKPPRIETVSLPPVLTEQQKQLVEFVQFCLKAFCHKEEISSSHVSTKAELEWLVRDYFSGSFDASRHRLLTGWRMDAVGKEVLECLTGNVGVKYDPACGGLVFTRIPATE